MTRQRLYGSDVPFCDWMRKHPELPSYSSSMGFAASDADVFIHRYLHVVDANGTRDIQSLAMLEIKTRNGEPTWSQADTLYKLHQSMVGTKEIESVIVWNFGVSFISISDERPDKSDCIKWGRFQGASKVRWRKIGLDLLLDLLKFERHHDNLEKNPFRRHHKTSEIWRLAPQPLGFMWPERIVKRS